MIVFTKLYNAWTLGDSRILVKLLGYVKRKTEATPEEWKGLFWMTGRKLIPDRRTELRRMEQQFLKTNYVRMIVFSPLQSLKPELLAKYTENAMWLFFRMVKINSGKFVYGLHFNTKHPHTHVIMTANMGREIDYKRWQINALHDAAHKAFDEPIGAAAYDVYGKEIFASAPEPINKRRYGAREPYQKHVEETKEDLKNELDEVMGYEEVGSIDDVYDMEI